MHRAEQDLGCCASTVGLRRRTVWRYVYFISTYGHTTTLQRWQLMRDGEAQSLAINSVCCSNNGDVLRAAALAGQGITKLPTFLVGPDIKERRLKVVLPNYPPTDLGLFALYAPNRYLAAKTRLLIDFLASRFGERPRWDDFAQLLEPDVCTCPG